MAEREVEKWITVNGRHVPIYKDEAGAIDNYLKNPPTKGEFKSTSQTVLENEKRRAEQIKDSKEKADAFNKQKTIDKYVGINLRDTDLFTNDNKRDKFLKELGYDDYEIERVQQFCDALDSASPYVVMGYGSDDFIDEVGLHGIKLSNKPNEYKLLVGNTKKTANWEDASYYDASESAFNALANARGDFAEYK